MPVRQEHLFQGYPTGSEAVTLRVIGTSEGLTFCALSTQAGAFIIRPGERLVVNLLPTVQATTQYYPLAQQQYQGPVPPGTYQAYGGYQQLNQQYAITGWSITVVKETEIPEQTPDV